jgi:hypothetical protein
MKLIGIRTPKPRKYTYKPVYNDPVKDDRENRFKESGFNDNQVGSELRMRMQLRMNRKKLDERIRKRSLMMSILFTFLLLLLIFYYFFF